MKRLKGLAIAASLIMFTAIVAMPAAAEMTTIYGTVNIGNHDWTGHDKRTKHRFSAPVEGDGVIVIKSSGVSPDNRGRRHDEESGERSERSNTFHKVKIKLNDEEVAAQNHFDKGTQELRYNVHLLQSNVMKVTVDGCRSCSLELSVLENRDSAESPITAPPVPPPPPPPALP